MKQNKTKKKAQGFFKKFLPFFSFPIVRMLCAASRIAIVSRSRSRKGVDNATKLSFHISRCFNSNYFIGFKQQQQQKTRRTLYYCAMYVILLVYASIFSPFLLTGSTNKQKMDEKIIEP